METSPLISYLQKTRHSEPVRTLARESPGHYGNLKGIATSGVALLAMTQPFPGDPLAVAASRRWLFAPTPGCIHSLHLPGIVTSQLSGDPLAVEWVVNALTVDSSAKPPEHTPQFVIPRSAKRDVGIPILKGDCHTSLRAGSQ